jgi:hypothetical protein
MTSWSTPGVGDLSTFVQGDLAKQGQDGADGADGVAGWTSANSSAVWASGPAGTSYSSWAACPDGTAALGGGFRAAEGLEVVTSSPTHLAIDPDLVDDPATPVNESVVPSDDGSPNGWLVTGSNNGNDDLTVEPWVLCAAVN